MSVSIVLSFLYFTQNVIRKDSYNILLIFISISLLIILVFFFIPKCVLNLFGLPLLYCISSKCNGMVAVCNKLNKKSELPYLSEVFCTSIVFLKTIIRFAILVVLWVAWCDVVDNGLILRKTCLQRSLVV